MRKSSTRIPVLHGRAVRQTQGDGDVAQVDAGVRERAKCRDRPGCVSAGQPRGARRPTPAGSERRYRARVQHSQVADEIVASVLEWGSEPAAGCTVEAAERVEVAGEGPGVAVLWSRTTREQGLRRFGLLLSVRAFDVPGVTTDVIVRNLLHMLREPHATAVSDRTRTWYVQAAPPSL